MIVGRLLWFLFSTLLGFHPPVSDVELPNFSFILLGFFSAEENVIINENESKAKTQLPEHNLVFQFEDDDDGMLTCGRYTNSEEIFGIEIKAAHFLVTRDALGHCCLVCRRVAHHELTVDCVSTNRRRKLRSMVSVNLHSNKIFQRRESRKVQYCNLQWHIIHLYIFMFLFWVEWKQWIWKNTNHHLRLCVKLQTRR